MLPRQVDLHNIRIPRRSAEIIHTSMQIKRVLNRLRFPERLLRSLDLLVRCPRTVGSDRRLTVPLERCRVNLLEL